MIFVIHSLGFAIGSLLLEGWAAFAARCACALALLALGALARSLLRKKLFPKLLAHSWHFEATHILPCPAFRRRAGRGSSWNSLRWKLTRKGAKATVQHGNGPAKQIAAAAIPDVIRYGEQIGFVENWKGPALKRTFWPTV